VISVARIEQLHEMVQSWYAQPLPPNSSGENSETAAVFHHGSQGRQNDDNQDAYSCGLIEMLKEVVAVRGSDLHLVAGSAPRVRIDGTLRAMPLPKLRPHHIRQLVSSVLTGPQQSLFEKEMELDFSFGLKTIGRFRANVFFQRGSMGATFRAIPNTIPTLESLGMPAVLHNFVGLERGLVLVTGPTGVGKSTTLAAMIDEMNHTRCSNIVTLEDPIEYVHWHGNCVISQRQVGACQPALKSDPPSASNFDPPPAVRFAAHCGS